jgi:hypothetical protein
MTAWKVKKEEIPRPFDKIRASKLPPEADRQGLQIVGSE